MNLYQEKNNFHKEEAVNQAQNEKSGMSNDLISNTEFSEQNYAFDLFKSCQNVKINKTGFKPTFIQELFSAKDLFLKDMNIF